MPKMDKADRRDNQRRKARQGMRVSGRSIRDVLAGLMGWTPRKEGKKKQ